MSLNSACQGLSDSFLEINEEELDDLKRKLEPFQVNLANFNSVDQHVSSAGIVESFNQRNADRFSAARLAHERQSLARFDARFQTFEDEQIAASRIRKLDIGEFYVADDFRLFAFF